MGMDNLPEPDQNTTAEICIEIEGVNHANWPAAFAAFKAAVRAALNNLEASVPVPGKKIRTSGSHKKKR
jgi:hypothetical protein